ncbi:hypothetical protein [Nitrincola nitratireducens]|uniref:Bacterial repeat domain-containing protein n=1 Tax=Nitrincola nitratireducens TaxID=1229521 RepID=W9V0J1_9GAMM|nr:hypothetical protein [Nitrincola nitratireducens]EXJ10476.1 hypothetical protein D791_02541 [Nitrincola nitratireducens]
MVVDFNYGCVENQPTNHGTTFILRLVRVGQSLVTANVNFGGEINHNSLSLLNGQVAEFTLTPNEGYKINPRVKGSCSQGQWINENTYQTGTIVSNCTIEFGFNEIKRNARKGLPVWLLVQ